MCKRCKKIPVAKVDGVKMKGENINKMAHTSMNLSEVINCYWNYTIIIKKHRIKESRNHEKQTQ